MREIVAYDANPRAARMALLADEFSACRALFVALGDEHRQLVFLDLLRHYGGLRTCEIAHDVGLSRAAVSRHLKVMQDAGIVSSYRSGTMRFYHPSENLRAWSMLAHLACESRSFVADMSARDRGLRKSERRNA